MRKQEHPQRKRNPPANYLPLPTAHVIPHSDKHVPPHAPENLFHSLEEQCSISWNHNVTTYKQLNPRINILTFCIAYVLHFC